MNKGDNVVAITPEDSDMLKFDIMGLEEIKVGDRGKVLDTMLQSGFNRRFGKFKVLVEFENREQPRWVLDTVLKVVD